MNDLLQAGFIAVELIKRRDLLRKAAGDSYAKRQAPARALITAVAKRTGNTFLETGRVLATKAIEDGEPAAADIILAAAVDLTEEHA